MSNGGTRDASSAPPIFDRDVPVNHPWHRAFRELEDGVDWTWRTVVGNWRIDHRVEAQREAVLVDGYANGTPLGGEEWQVARGRYFHEALVRPVLPGAAGAGSALYRDENASNRIQQGPAPFNQLVHVASLNSLLARFATKEHVTIELNDWFGDTLGVGLPTPTAGGMGDGAWERRYVDEIAELLQERGDDAVRELAGLLCDAPGERQPHWWGAFHEEVRSHLTEGRWSDLCRALGLGHLYEGTWLLTWRYPVEVVGPLIRPTVVEADASPYHFPSPPRSDYGITMPLASGMRRCREVVHPPLRGERARRQCTGVLGRIAEPVVADHTSVAASRTEHRRRLEEEFDAPPSRRWLKRCEPWA